MREAERALPDQRLVELFDPAPVQAPGWRWPRAPDAARWVRDHVLTPLATGTSNRQIADELVVTVDMVKSTSPTSSTS